MNIHLNSQWRLLIRLTLGAALILSLACPIFGKDKGIQFILQPAKKTLIVSLGSRRLVINQIYVSPYKDTPSEWIPERLLSPKKDKFLVPMADSSYRLYQIIDGEIVLDDLLEGGTSALGAGGYWRSRHHWTITGWSGDDTVELLGDVGHDGHVAATINITDCTFKITSGKMEDNVLSLRFVSLDRTIETRLRRIIE